MKRKAAMMLMMGNRDGYEMESRFRDRRGYPHYENGRFAPRNEYVAGDVPAYTVNNYWLKEDDNSVDSRYPYYAPTSRKRRYFIESDDDINSRGTVYPNMTYNEPRRRIGFGNRNEFDSNYDMNATYSQMDEMDYKPPKHQMGFGRSTKARKEFDEDTAKEWTRTMKNADGSRGAHWTMDQTTQVMRQYNINCDPVEFFTVMNIIYSDYSSVLKKFGANSVEVYANLAKAWLEDEDAVPDKLQTYYECIVK